MISEFEQRLADVLGSRLPAPFAGRVQVAPGTAPGNQPRLLVGVQQVDLSDPDFGSRRPELAPGANDPRRVLRMQCQVGLTLLAGAGQGRGQQMLGLDAALYALDAADFRDGSALRGGAADPGFLIQRMSVGRGDAPLDPAAPNAAPVGLTLLAEGWFWPVGVAGEAGRAIGEVRIRGAVLPIDIVPATPLLVANGPPVELQVRIRSVGVLRVGAEPLSGLPFGVIGLALVGPGGQPGAGTLTGGAAGLNGARLLNLTDEAATVTYTPPAESASDTLIVALHDGNSGLGVELGRMPLPVGEG
jgi:hypothetical protein